MTSPIRIPLDRPSKLKHVKVSPYIIEKYGLDRKGHGPNGELSFTQKSHIMSHNKPTMNNKQRVYIMVIFLLWFALGNILHQHMGMPMLPTLLINSLCAPLINSLCAPLCLAVPCLMVWDYLGGKKIPYLDSPS